MIDKVLCVSRMDYFETVFIAYWQDRYMDTTTLNETFIDAFIEDCIAAEMITREHLYYPKS